MWKFLPKPAARSQGFTLVEIIIYLGLVSIFLVVIATIFTSIIDIRVNTVGESSLNREGRLLTSQLRSLVRQHPNVLTPAAVGDSGQVLQLQTDTGVQQVQLGAETLEITDTTGSYVLTTFPITVTEFIVTRKGVSGQSEAIQLDVTLQDQADLQTNQETYQTVIALP